MLKSKLSQLNNQRLNQIITRYVYYFIKIYLITLYRTVQFIINIARHTIFCGSFGKNLQYEENSKTISDTTQDYCIKSPNRSSKRSYHKYEFQAVGTPRQQKRNMIESIQNKESVSYSHSHYLIKPIDLILYTNTAGTAYKYTCRMTQKKKCIFERTESKKNANSDGSNWEKTDLKFGLPQIQIAK